MEDNSDSNRPQIQPSDLYKDNIPPTVPFTQELDSDTMTPIGIGDLLNVQRSNGQIDSGWLVLNIDPATQIVSLVKTDGDDTLAKKIPLTELYALNPRAASEFKDLVKARNFGELFYSLHDMGTILGVDKKYSAIELIDLINDVRIGKLSPDVLTRTGNLRQKVVELMAAKEIQNQMAKSPEDSEVTEQDKFDFCNYVRQGGNLIKAKRFDEAQQYFRNQSVVEKINRDFVDGRVEIMNRLPTDEEIVALSHFVAMNSWCMNGSIQLSGVIFFDPKNKSNNMQCPDALQHEIVLIYLEEWLHAVQDLTHSDVAGFQNAEVDVAAYMDLHDIPMTEAFLHRHGRKEALEEIKKMKR